MDKEEGDPAASSAFFAQDGGNAMTLVNSLLGVVQLSSCYVDDGVVLAGEDETEEMWGRVIRDEWSTLDTKALVVTQRVLFSCISLHCIIGHMFPRDMLFFECADIIVLLNHTLDGLDTRTYSVLTGTANPDFKC